MTTTNPPPMTCAEARLRLSAIHDGERELDAALDAHLVACVDCRAHRHGLADLAARLGPAFEEARALAPPPDLGDRIVERAARRPTALGPLRTWAPRVAAGVLGFLVVRAGAQLDARRRPPVPNAAEVHAALRDVARWLDPASDGPTLERVLVGHLARLAGPAAVVEVAPQEDAR